MSETINFSEVEPDGKSDLIKGTKDALTSVNVKIAFILYLVGMLIFSDIFINNVLSMSEGSVDGNCTTTKGTMLQLLMLVLAYIFIDVLVKVGWV